MSCTPSIGTGSMPVRAVANIGWVTASYPDGRSYSFVGGAGLHLSLAVVKAGGQAAPVAVVGDDLVDAVAALEERGVDTRSVKVVENRPSCRFELSYDDQDGLVSAESTFGAADLLNQHARTQLDLPGHFHISCRRPLDAAPILAELVESSFSLDFYAPSAAEYIRVAEPFLSYAATVFANREEYALLSGRVATSNLKALVVSDGARDVALYSRGEVIAVARPPTVVTPEVTGSGDVLAGTYLARVSDGTRPVEALDSAVRAASNAATQSDPLSWRT